MPKAHKDVFNFFVFGESPKFKSLIDYFTEIFGSVKLFLLILPCTSEIAGEMSVFLESGISVAWQHLTVSIYIDTFAGGLLKKHFKVF